MFREKKIIYTPGRKPSAPEYDNIEFDGNRVSIMRLPQFGIFHLSESITMESLEAAVIQFCRDFCDVPFAKVQLVEKVTYQDILDSYNKQLEGERISKGRKERGEKTNIIITKNVLEKILGEERVLVLGEVNYGYFDEKGELCAKLKDGSSKQITRTPLERIK